MNNLVFLPTGRGTWPELCCFRFWLLQFKLLWLLEKTNIIWILWLFNSTSVILSQWKMITWTVWNRTLLLNKLIYEPPHDKTSKMTVHPAMTQISLGICPVWTEYSLSAWRKLGSLVDSEDWSDRADAQAYLSLHWVQSFCWFCHDISAGDDKTNKLTCAPSMRPVWSVCALWAPKKNFRRSVKSLIRLRKCAGWSESLLGTQIFLMVLSCSCSKIIFTRCLRFMAF